MPGKKSHVLWMLGEERFLRLHYGTAMSVGEICENLPRHSWSAIRSHATKKLDLMRPTRKGEYRPTPTWDRMKVLLQTEKLTVNELIERLNVTQQRVAELIGLHRDEIYVFDRVPSPESGGHRKLVYAYGNEPDAPGSMSVRRAKEARSFNPFATAAGLISAPTGTKGRVFRQDMKTYLHDDELECAA